MVASLSNRFRLLADLADLTIHSHPAVLLHRRARHWDQRSSRRAIGYAPVHLLDDLGLPDLEGVDDAAPADRIRGVRCLVQTRRSVS